MILFTSPKEFQDVRAYKMILSQKTFVSVSQTPFAISTFVFRGSESGIILFRISIQLIISLLMILSSYYY